MGPQTPPFPDDEDTTHREQVLNDLTIIQAHAQLMMRRIDEHYVIDHNDTYQRLGVVVEAVKRLTMLHR